MTDEHEETRRLINRELGNCVRYICLCMVLVFAMLCTSAIISNIILVDSTCSVELSGNMAMAAMPPNTIFGNVSIANGGGSMVVHMPCSAMQKNLGGIYRL